MQHIKILGLSLVAVLATTAAAASSASAAPQLLQLTEGGAALVPGATVHEESGFTINAGPNPGTFTCTVESDVMLTNNDAKNDELSNLDTGYNCTGPMSFFSRGGISVTSFGATGKGTSSVTIFIPGLPAPYEHCVYTGKTTKDNEVKAHNSTSGPIVFSVTNAKLKGKECPSKKATVSSTYWHLHGPGLGTLEDGLI